jgi:anti-sigma B factor antagonist
MESTKLGDCLVIGLKEKRLDAVIAMKFRDAVIERIDPGQARVVLDMACVNFMDSSGLGALVAVLKHVGNDGSLHLCGVTPGVMAVLRLTRMDRALRTFDSREAAAAG